MCPGASLYVAAAAEKMEGALGNALFGRVTVRVMIGG